MDLFKVLIQFKKINEVKTYHPYYRIRIVYLLKGKRKIKNKILKLLSNYTN